MRARWRSCRPRTATCAPKIATYSSALTEQKRQAPEAFIERLVAQLAPIEAHKKTRGMALPLLIMLAERAANVEAAKPADTPIYWDGAVRTQQFGRDANTLRKPIDLLERYKFVDRDYDYLGPPGSGDHRRRVKVTFATDLPVDIPDAANAIRRRIVEEEPRRELPKRSQGCAPCRTAACPDHPKGARAEAYPHPLYRVRTGSGARPRPRAAGAEQSGGAGRNASPLGRGGLHGAREREGAIRLKISVLRLYLTHLRLKFSVEPRPATMCSTRRSTRWSGWPRTSSSTTLPPLKAQTLKLKLYQQVVQMLQAGRPAPTAEQCCDDLFLLPPAARGRRDGRARTLPVCGGGVMSPIGAGGAVPSV